MGGRGDGGPDTEPPVTFASWVPPPDAAGTSTCLRRFLFPPQSKRPPSLCSDRPANREILLLCCFGHLDESVVRYFELVTGQYEDWFEDAINKEGVQRGGSGGHLARLHPPRTSS